MRWVTDQALGVPEISAGRGVALLLNTQLMFLKKEKDPSFSEAVSSDDECIRSLYWLVARNHLAARVLRGHWRSCTSCKPCGIAWKVL